MEMVVYGRILYRGVRFVLRFGFSFFVRRIDCRWVRGEVERYVNYFRNLILFICALFIFWMNLKKLKDLFYSLVNDIMVFEKEVKVIFFF